MVQESESRFCSDQQTILQVLDPIHRSLLINNSEFESINNNTPNPVNRSPTNTCELFERQQQQLLLQQQQQQQHQEKQRQKNSTENKHLCDASFSKKPDATCVSDSDCLMLFQKELNMPEEFECTIPSNDKKQNLNERQAKKNIQIRIVTNKKRSSEHKSLERQRMSSESQTDSSTYDYVDTDEEEESSNSAADENCATDTYDCSDFNDFDNFESSSNEESTPSFSSSNTNAPMIHIVQEITEQHTVVSTVLVNKKKVKSFQQTKVNRVTVSSNGQPKWKNKQKIIDDNVCNEILDETINWNVIEGEKQNNGIESPPVVDTVIIGELKAKPKFSQRKMGKLMERRLSRALSDNITLSPTQENRNSTDFSSSPTPTYRSSAVPPAKPPRTFASSSSKASSNSIGANTATTLPIEDFHKSLTSNNSPQISPGGGWMFDKTHRSVTKPTCPTLEDINDFEKSKKIGWVPSLSQREEFLHVLNMLSDGNRMSSKITSANLTPEPQFQIPCKEDIDQVDSSLPPKPILRRSRHFSMELNDSMSSSTPVKRASHISSHSVPYSTHSEMEVCKKCKLQIMKPSGARKSFGKGAIKRTKLFFKASKNIWNKPKPLKQMETYENCSENEFYDDLDYDVDVETPTKTNLNTTADFNTNHISKIEKRTEKALDLTPKQPANTNNIESPRRILNKLLTSVKRTPPKKPIRQSLVPKDITRSPSNNEEDNFNFDRVVDSPKSKEKGFKLSPRKLFCSTNERSNEAQHNSYRSFEADQKDDLKQCIVEYLRNMNEKIDHEQGDVECATVPRWRSRVRNFSISSDAIDDIPQRQRVQIDFHPEPVYSEIIVQPHTSSLNHIIVNDNPKAIYATVNKTKHRNVVAPMSSEIHEINTANEEAIYKSWNSLDKLSMNNNLADSILNMLEFMKQQNSDDSTRPENTLKMQEIDESKLQSVGSKVKNCIVMEPLNIGLTSERLQQSALNHDKALNDNTSMETFFTESICDDVIRGDSVNNNIVSMIDQLENMDLISTISLVESETDDETNEQYRNIDYIDHAYGIKTDSGRDRDDDYCCIVKENTKRGPTTSATDKGKENQRTVHFNATKGEISGNRRDHKLQSPLVAAPSMIEIPDQFMLKLTDQIIAQREIRNQLKHAIKICRTTKEFECSSELIEAERLMLLSAKKETCAKLELTRIDYEENGLTASPAKCFGTVTIKKIEFDLKPEELLEEIFQLSYICICSYRDQVVATHFQERSGNKVKFDDIGIKIGRLNSMFEINVEVYVLRLPRPLRKYSHESKYHLNKIPKKSLFPNPVKLFSNSSVSNSKSTSDMEESRFRLRGASTISAKSLSSEKFEIVRNVSWPKNHVYLSYNLKSLNLKINDQFTNMTGTLRTEFICEVSLSDSGLNGFISIAEETGLMREAWCRIIGCTMEFWNNDIDCFNKKSPIFSIDLIKCTNDLFEMINDKFAVDIFSEELVGQTEKNRIKRYWLSAHKRSDLILWLTDLNRILKFIKDWNI